MATTYVVAPVPIVQRRFRLEDLPPPEVRRVGAGRGRVADVAVADGSVVARGVRSSASVLRW